MALISVTMALDSLREQVTAVNEAKDALTREMAYRDDLIRSARESKVPERTLVKLTGLSRDSIHRIANSPSKTYNNT